MYDNLNNEPGENALAPLPSASPEEYVAEGLEWAEEPEAAGFDPETVFRCGLKNHHVANTAYPISHRTTVWGYRRPEAEHAALLKRAFESQPRMSLYAHVPFCENRCSYCEYAVVENHSGEAEDAYFRYLFQELDFYDNLIDFSASRLEGFDIGGGTPTLVSPGMIEKLVGWALTRFRLSPGFLVSTETTPRIAALMPERLACVRSCGVSRISMGLQTADADLLKRYGRDQNSPGFNERAAENIWRAGFSRFNVDVMYGFSGQSVESFLGSIGAAVRLGPHAITLYRMRYKGTRVRDEAKDVGLDHVTRMYREAHDALGRAGYLAGPGKNTFSRVPGEDGTSAYLTGRVVHSVPYLGVGLGAQTFTNNLLAYNQGAATKRMEEYARGVRPGLPPIQDLYLLPKSEGMAKMASVSFYFGRVYLGAFAARFGERLEDRFPAEVDFVVREGLMEFRGQYLQLTTRGADRSNGVIPLFYSDRVKSHLLGL